MGCAPHKTLWQAPDLKDTQKLFVTLLLERRSLRPTEEQEQSANSPKEGSPGFKKSFWFPYSPLQRGTVFSPHNSWVSNFSVAGTSQSVWRGGQPSSFPSQHTSTGKHISPAQKRHGEEEGTRFIWGKVHRLSESPLGLTICEACERLWDQQKTCNGLKRRTADRNKAGLAETLWR